MRWAVAISLVVHAALALALRSHAPPAAGARAAPAIELEVDMVAAPAPAPEAAPGPEPGGDARAEPAGEPARVASTTTARRRAGGRAAVESGPARGLPEAKGDGPRVLLGMRGGAGLDLSPARGAALVEPGEPRAPLGPPPGPPGIPTVEIAPPPPDIVMEPRGGGRYEIRDPRFEKVTIAADGRMHIEDRPLVDAGIEKPCPRCVKEDLKAWWQNPMSGRRVRLSKLLPRPFLKLELMDWLLRKMNNDPYLARKRALYDRTRETRQAMAAEAREDRLRDSIPRLPELLAAVWANEADWSVATRRQLLFDLWDECTEDGRGLEARATIVAFIRKHAIVYPPAELAALNARRTSREPFAP